MKAVVEIIEGLKKLCPKTFRGIRLCAEELLDDGARQHSGRIHDFLQDRRRGGIDYFSVTAGGRSPSCRSSAVTSSGKLAPFGQAIQENVKVPIMMAYRLFDPSIPHKAIEKGELDIWEMWPAMIADLCFQEGARGTGAGHSLVRGVQPLLARLFRDAPMTCYINPCVPRARPRYTNPPPADPKKNIMIVVEDRPVWSAPTWRPRGAMKCMCTKSGKSWGGPSSKHQRLPTATMNS